MYILVLFLTVYFVFLIYSLVPPMNDKSADGPGGVEGLTVVIPFRDEAENLPRIIESLGMVKFSFPVEFIFVDDHSRDDSASIAESFPSAIVILSVQKGKKQAIQLGVKKAKYPWILTLDADVKISQEFVSTLDGLSLGTTKMFLFSLSPIRRKGIIAAFFDLEFIALQAIGIGMAQRRKPILSNGACLLFEKVAFSEADQNRQDYHIPSGDDIFGMFAIADLFGKSAVKVGSVEPLVTVSFPEKMRTLFNQRSRWIAKTLDVPDLKYKLLAFLMGVIHLTPLGVLGALLYGLTWPNALSLLFIKWVGEWIFFWICTRNYGRRDLLLFLPLSQLLYPIYTFALIVSGVHQKLQFKKTKLNAAG